MSAVCLQPLRLFGGCRDTNVLRIQMPLPPDIWWVGGHTTARHSVGGGHTTARYSVGGEHTTANAVSLTKMLRCFSLRIKMLRCRRQPRDFSSCFIIGKSSGVPSSPNSPLSSWNFWAKWSKWAENGSVWIPQALNHSSLNQVGNLTHCFWNWERSLIHF